MKVLSISTDRKLFDEESSVLLRQKEYAGKMDEMHIVVFSLKDQNFSDKKFGNLYIYPTNSSSKLLYIYDAVKIGKKIIKNFATSQNTVITCQDPFETGIVGYILQKKFHLPLQLQVHTDFLSPYFINSGLNQFRTAIANFLIPKAQGIRVVSSVILDSIRDNFKNIKARVDTLPVFVDLEVFSGDSSVQVTEKTFLFDFVILMASRLTEEKRIDTALAAFKKVLDKFPKTGLLICGSGPEEENLSSQAKDYKLINNVVFMGWRNDLVSLYKNTDIFLLTSEYEGYGMTLVEAGASGLPIVTTKVGLAKTDLFKNGENSHVCPVGDIDCIATALIDLITDEQKRKLFKDKMRDSIKSKALTREDYLKKYVSLLESLIN